MVKSNYKRFKPAKFGSAKISRRLFLSFVLLLLYKVGTILPLPNINQELLKQDYPYLISDSSLRQLLSMYVGNNASISFFSLGIVPFINASLLIDTLVNAVPFLEALQTEEGEKGKEKIFFFKKILAIVIASIESFLLLNYIKPYLLDTTFFAVALNGLELVTGSLVVIWISNLIEIQGFVNNGTSLLIFVNIFFNFIEKIINTNFSFEIILEAFFLSLFGFVLNKAQNLKIAIPIVSAKQLNYLKEEKIENAENEKNFLPIKYNQSGIFPLILASNLLGFLSFLGLQFIFKYGIIQNLFYYGFIIGFNYFYALVFWDPEKVANQLRKSSVSVVGVKPGLETVKHLKSNIEKVSIKGGIILSGLIILFEFFSKLPYFIILPELNVSSIIIAIGVIAEVFKSYRSLSIAELLRNDTQKSY